MQKVLENRCQSCKKSDNIWGKYTSRAISPIYILKIFTHLRWKEAGNREIFCWHLPKGGEEKARPGKVEPPPGWGLSRLSRWSSSNRAGKIFFLLPIFSSSHTYLVSALNHRVADHKVQDNHLKFQKGEDSKAEIKYWIRILRDDLTNLNEFGTFDINIILCDTFW